MAELSNGSTTEDIRDTTVVQKSGLPADEVYTYFNQLKSLKYIKMAMRVSGPDFTLLNITREGLENSSRAANHQLK